MNDEDKNELKRAKARAKSRAWYIKNKTKRAAIGKAYYETHKETIATKRKEYRKSNRDKIKAYELANKEKIAARKKLWYQENREWILKKKKA